MKEELEARLAPWANRADISFDIECVDGIIQVHACVSGQRIWTHAATDSVEEAYRYTSAFVLGWIASRAYLGYRS